MSVMMKMTTVMIMMMCVVILSPSVVAIHRRAPPQQQLSNQQEQQQQISSNSTLNASASSNTTQAIQIIPPTPEEILSKLSVRYVNLRRNYFQQGRQYVTLFQEGTKEARGLILQEREGTNESVAFSDKVNRVVACIDSLGDAFTRIPEMRLRLNQLRIAAENASVAQQKLSEEQTLNRLVPGGVSSFLQVEESVSAMAPPQIYRRVSTRLETIFGIVQREVQVLIGQVKNVRTAARQHVEKVKSMIRGIDGVSTFITRMKAYLVQLKSTPPPISHNEQNPLAQIAKANAPQVAENTALVIAAREAYHRSHFDLKLDTISNNSLLLNSSLVEDIIEMMAFSIQIREKYSNAIRAYSTRVVEFDQMMTETVVQTQMINDVLDDLNEMRKVVNTLLNGDTLALQYRAQFISFQLEAEGLHKRLDEKIRDFKARSRFVLESTKFIVDAWNVYLKSLQMGNLLLPDVLDNIVTVLKQTGERNGRTIKYMIEVSKAYEHARELEAEAEKLKKLALEQKKSS